MMNFDDDKDFLILVSNHSYNISPTWSSDGKKINYVSNVDRAFKLYIMDYDGSNKECITPELDSINISDASWYTK